MAQSPMESTIRDFWKMIVERECRVVVMLCGLEEDGNVCYHKLCLVNNNDCVCYRKCVTSTGLLLLPARVEKYNELSVECKQENSSSAGYISHEVYYIHYTLCLTMLQYIIVHIDQ